MLIQAMPNGPPDNWGGLYIRICIRMYSKSQNCITVYLCMCVNTLLAPAADVCRHCHWWCTLAHLYSEHLHSEQWTLSQWTLAESICSILHSNATDYSALQCIKLEQNRKLYSTKVQCVELHLSGAQCIISELHRISEHCIVALVSLMVHRKLWP